jgi:adenosine deaminase
MSNAIETLAKVDVCCHFDGALPEATLRRLANARNRPEAGDKATFQKAVLAKTWAELQAARQRVRTLFASEQELEDAAADLGRALVAQTIVHAEVVVDPLGFANVDLAPLDVLCAIDRGFQSVISEDEESFLSWVLIVELRRDVDSTAALALIEAVTADIELPPRLGGIAIAGEGEAQAGIAALTDVLKMAREKDLRVVATAGEECKGHNPVGKARVREALAAGVQRLVGGSAALLDPDATLQLRAHRLPIVVLPSAQVLHGAAKSLAQHPVRKMKDAGLFTVIGSGWPTLLGTSLAGEFEHLSQHHHWRLDDIRNVTNRAIEAAFMHPNLRFGLARTVETWRHRPLPNAAAKGDNWSL